MPATSVYSAEDQWSAVLDRGGLVDFFGSRLTVPVQRRFGDVASVQRYCSAVLGLEPVRTAYPRAGAVAVRERAGQSRAHYEVATATIAIPLRETWAGRETVVLHELTHHLLCTAEGGQGLDRTRRQWHGIAFRDALCRLAETVLGPPAALLLRAGYEEAGLRTVPASA